MPYSDAARSCLHSKDYQGYFENTKKQYEKTHSAEDKREMDKAQRTLALHKEIQEFIKKKNSDYYAILGVQKSASQDDIRRAFNALLMKFHPDRTKMSESSDVSAIIQNAYTTLGNPEKRKAYDRRLASGSAFSHTTFRHSHPEDIMSNIFFTTFSAHAQRSSVFYSTQDLYQHLYSNMNRRHTRTYRAPRMQPQEPTDPRVIVAIVLIILLFIILQ
ncbi:DnaJ domain-containing protein [Ordospora pajunii]|uniref:DnaJ domain-containing protein n=1 Tax=Ordospora pajunii TaxID=3039483 RepID=UPI0029526E5E|nr:DnaJ domain-containing protein [Ordospora pajunii]KAH9411432.1 DnaJ domain-containing protein [Ordospora pajunii]